MPTGHGDGLAICRLEDRSRRRQPCSFLRRSGLRARRRVSPAPHSAQARVKHLVLLHSMLTLLNTFVLLSSLFYPALPVSMTSCRFADTSSEGNFPISA